MFTVGNYFHRHIIHQENTFHRSFVFIFTTLVETRHCVVELCRMGKTCRIGFFDILEFGFRMRNGSQDTFRPEITGEIMRTRQFRTGIPTLNTVRTFQDRHIFFLIRIFHIIKVTGHLGIQIRSFHMKSQYGTILFRHQLLANGDCLADRFFRRRRQSGKNSSRTVFHMGGNSTMEGFFRTFLKIMAASAMHVHGYETGNDIHTLGIHHLGADNSQVAVRHFQNLSITNQYGAILQPSLRGKDLAIYYLCQHKSKQFIRSFH